MSGGEKLEGGEVNTGWEDVASLADQARNLDYEGERDSDKLDEASEYERARLQAMNRMVFTDVNPEMISGLVDIFINAINVDRLNDVRVEMRDNFEQGVKRAEEFFAELLEIKATPKVKLKELGDNRLGVCRMGESLDAPDTIVISTECKKDPDLMLSVMAHENWHSYQHKCINEAIKAIEDGTNDYDLQADLYLHNELNYINAKDDIHGYMTQLVEAEAFAFEDRFQNVVKEIDKAEKEKEFVTSHPEIYDTENLSGIEEELKTVFSGMDIDMFLAKAGVEDVLGLISQFGDPEKFAQQYMTALLDLVGVRDEVEVEFVDGSALSPGGRGRMDYKEKKVYLNRENQDGLLTSVLPKFAWAFRQRDKASDMNDSGHAKLYRDNNMHFITRKQDPVKFEEQLLIRERSEFADKLLGILDEQALEEEIAREPLPKRVLMKLEQRRRDALPVLSRKYGVKGGK